MLKVEKVDFHTGENAEAHRTNKFEICHQCDATTVLRRGQVFKLSVTFDRSFQPEKDNVRIFFRCNGMRAPPKVMPAIERTTVTSTSKISYEKDLWSIALSKIDGKTIHVLIRSPQILPFNTFKLIIKTNLKDNPEEFEKYIGKDVFFLFNPWMKGDEVYMADTKMLDEYVLDDVGKVYTYKNGKPNGREWVFGQFGEKILPALILMMSNSDLGFLERGNPVHLSREITRMLSTGADGGVLHGDWSGDYSGGTAPFLWNSSVPIFEEYYDNDGDYVSYGQCWVFSALTVTACRAIGIPCRSVTNYDSAHDINKSMTIDLYILPEEKKKPEDERKDSIWNFHVWNDAWMARYDLPEGYGGWQAIDATPQECDDEGNFQCGPCSLEAVKKGEIGYNYDGPFVNAEVNADVITWTYVDEDTWKPISINKTHVGKIVLTKLPFIYDPHGNNDFEDITDQYKSPEGSKEERLSFYNAVKQCSNTDVYKITHESKVTFCFSEIDSVDLGNDFFVTVSMVNNDTVKKTISLNLTATSMYYNGCRAHLIKDGTITLDLSPGKSNLGKLRVSPDEYAHLLVDFSIIKIHCIAKVSEENFIWAAEDKFSIKMPEMIIKSAGDLECNVAGRLLFMVKNPLKKTLTKCKIVFECPGLGRNVTVPCSDIKAGEEVTMEHSVTPDVSGAVHLTSMFISDQLKCMSGKADLNIL